MSIVTSFIEKVEKNEIAFDPYLNYNTTKAMAEILKDEGNIDIVRMFLFLKVDVSLYVELEEVRNAYDRLEDYCLWQAKNHALRNLIFPAPCSHYWGFMVECVKR